MKKMDSVTDCELLERLSQLSGKENRVIAEIVLHLFHVDKRGIFREAGYSSLFSYCTEGLKYSVGAASRRITAARALKTSPELYELLKEGNISLCAISSISKVITAENKEELVEKSTGKSKAQVELIASEYGEPEKPKQERIRAKRVIVPSKTLSFDGEQEPQEEKCFSVHLEFTEEEMELLQKGQKITGAARLKDVLLKGVTDLVKKEERKAKPKVITSTVEVKSCNSPKIQANNSNKKQGRYIPASVQREVRQRDSNQCTYCSPDGKRCTERYRLQIDHIRPYALGGTHKADNLRLLCRAHNSLFAERVFGKEKILGFHSRPTA